MSFALQLSDIYCHLLANPRRGTGGTVTRTGTHNLLRSPELHRGRPRDVCNGTAARVEVTSQTAASPLTAAAGFVRSNYEVKEYN